MRNLDSVGIRLKRYTESGLLRMVWARTITGSAETLLVHIKTLALEHKARCLVIDPVSTLTITGNELTAHGVAGGARKSVQAQANLITLCKTYLPDRYEMEVVAK
jgi:circadian clock protein KaiC